MYQSFAIFALIIFVYSTLARGIEKTPFGGALLFVATGYVLGPDVTGLVSIDMDRHGLRIIAEVTLALMLFTDAAKGLRFQTQGS